MKQLAFLLVICLSGCSSIVPDDVSVSIEDLPGAGNPEIEECQITFNGEVPLVPCVVTFSAEWDI